MQEKEETMKKTRKILAVLIFTTAVLNAAVFARPREEKPRKDYIVGKVGKTKVRISEIEKMALKLNRFLRENYRKSKEWRLNFIRNYIAQIALSRRAEREGLDKDKEIIKELERVKQSLLAEKMLQNAIKKGLKITEENLRKFYEENKASYRENERLKLSYVKAKAKKQLKRITKLLKKGESFKKAAGKKIAIIRPWVSKGGYISPELRKFLSGEIIETLSALKKGANSEIIEANKEFYVFHISDKEPAKDKPFEEVRKQLEFQYSTEEKERIVTSLVVETFKQEKVEIYEGKAVQEIE